MPKVVINFGHGPKNDGGYDPGAVAPDGYKSPQRRARLALRQSRN